jgi:hypothetical protein
MANLKFILTCWFASLGSGDQLVMPVLHMIYLSLPQSLKLETEIESKVNNTSLLE